LKKVLTDNSFLNEKTLIRTSILSPEKNYKVLDLFHGYGKIWEQIKRKGFKVDIVKIDKKNKDKENIVCDNLKILPSLNLMDFDIIDCDSYGVPFKQLEIIFKKKYHGFLFITFIQSQFGRLPVRFLNELGYTTNMINKIPSLFNRNGIEKFKQYLFFRGITQIQRISINNKHYMGMEV